MGISGMLRTSASGMAAQANRLSAVSDNIANVSTTGYKKAFAEFSSFIPTQGNDYNSGSVNTSIRHAISEQGSFKYTTSVTDLSVNGDGFFMVTDSSGQFFMTRSGAFVPNGDGELINSAGFQLMGYSLASGPPPIVANGTAGLTGVLVGNLALQAVPSTIGTFFVNLPSTAAIETDLPSTNSPTAVFTGKTSLVAVENLGGLSTLDVYSTKTAADTWEVTVFDRAQAASAAAPFPYASGPLVTTTLTFDPTTGQLAAASPTSITVPVPNGANLVIDLSETSQLAAPYTVSTTQVNGSAPSAVDHFEIAEDGTLSAVYANGSRVDTYQIPLAKVASVDNVRTLPGDVYQPSADSGDLQIGFAGAGGLGVVQSSALEQSTVDLASELTSMIESERNFQVNAKVFQTSADILDVIVNLKR
jgi:flagellar hook protein FlgE